MGILRDLGGMWVEMRPKMWNFLEDSKEVNLLRVCHHQQCVSCCAELCCAVLCCAVLCCGVLCCGVSCCAELCCAELYCAVLCCVVECCVVECRVVLSCVD